MTGWEPVIGLEIHVQLKTRTKMFCGCELSFGEEPNTRTCPVCLGLPGSLPVTNARAIHYGLLMGVAFGCELAPRPTDSPFSPLGAALWLLAPFIVVAHRTWRKR